MNKQQRREWRAQVFGHAELTPAQKLVLLALEGYADYPAGTNARPGVAALAGMCGLKTRAVEGALQSGRQLKLIEQTSRANPIRGLAAVYQLLTPRADGGDSTRVSMRIEGDVNPHEGADRNGIQPARNEIQPARNSDSTRTSVQPTNPYQSINTSESAVIRSAIDRCPDCDQYGRTDDLTDCPKHPNFRTAQASA